MLQMKVKKASLISIARLGACAVLLPLSALATAADDEANTAAPAPAVVEQPQTPPTQAVASKENPLVLAELKGLVFVPEMKQIKAQGIATAGVSVDGVAVLDDPAFRALVSPYLGQRLAMNDLQGLVDKVVVFCREHNRPVVDVMVPEQDVTAGTVQIVVIEGHLGSVSAVNNRWFKSDFLTSNVRLKAGEPVDAKTLNEDLAWLNRNPFRRVDAVFVQGGEPGVTDVQLQVQERHPVRAYASYENGGNSTIGKDIYSVGINWGNVFDTDQQAGYQYDRSGKGDALEAHHLNYSVPLPWRHVVNASVDHVSTDSSLFNAFGLSGKSTRVSARYWMPLPGPSALKGLDQSVQAGLDYKRSNNNLEFFGTQIFDDSTEIVQMVAQYNGTLADRHGINSWYANLVVSPGDLTGDNSDERFDETRAGAKATYAYTQLGYERQTRLPRDYTWAFRGTLQVATGRLLASEQFGLGGQNSVRGFEEREASGDDGLLVSNELRTPSLKVPGKNRFAEQSELQLLAFVDAGVAKTNDKRSGEKGEQSLAGTGVGVRYRIGNYFTAQADYGWQLSGKHNDPSSDSRAHVSIMLSY